MNAIVFRDHDRPTFDRTERHSDRPDHDEECLVSPPTPEEIRERCLEIQREWSPRERLKRAGYRHDPTQWRPPVVHVGESDLLL